MFYMRDYNSMLTESGVKIMLVPQHRNLEIIWSLVIYDFEHVV